MTASLCAEPSASSREELDLRVNGVPETVRGATLAALLESKGIDIARKGIAIAINGAVVPRARWAEQALARGDSIEIIQAKQGG